MLDFMDAIRAAAAAAARAAAEAAERARQAAEEAQRRAQEQARQAAQAQAQAQANKPKPPPPEPPKAQQATPAKTEPKADTPTVQNAIYTGNTTLALQQTNATTEAKPQQDAPPPDPEKAQREKDEKDAKALTDSWQKDAQDALDMAAKKAGGRELTDAEWKPLSQQYGNVMGGVQNELRVAANHAAKTGGDVTKAVNDKASEIKGRYKDDPIVQGNLDETKKDYLAKETTQDARNTEGARFKVIVSQEKADKSAAKLAQEQADYVKIPGGIRRAEPGLDDDLQTARTADNQAQAELERAGQDFGNALQKEIDTLAVKQYKSDADASLDAARNDTTLHNRYLREESLGSARQAAADAQTQLNDLQAGKGVKVPERYRTEAADQVKHRYDNDPQLGALVDRLNLKGRLQGELDHLVPRTDFEKKLAATDPTTLAMARTLDLTLDPEAKNDPNSALARDMPNSERMLMKEQPGSYVLYKYLQQDPSAQVKDGTQVHDMSPLLSTPVQQLSTKAGGDAKAPDTQVARQSLQRLFTFADVATQVRVDKMGTMIDQQLGRGDVAGALATRKAGVDAALTDDERSQYVGVRADRFNSDLFKSQIDASMRKDLKNKTYDDDNKYIQGQQTMYADKVGQYMQDVAPNLIPEDAQTLASTVKAEYGNDWTGRNDAAGAGYNDWDAFYSGLSAVVDKADQPYYQANPKAAPGSGPAAQDTARWLADRDNDVHVMVMQNQAGVKQGAVYGGARDAGSHGHIGLSVALAKALRNSDDAPLMAASDLERAYKKGFSEAAPDDKEVAEQNKLFELDKDEILNQAFDGLAMKKQDLTADVGDDAALDKAIRTALPNADPAGIDAIKQEIRDNAGGKSQVSVVPIYVTQPGGAPYQSAVFEFKGREGNTMWVDDAGAVYGKDGKDPKRDFQENNQLSDKGTVYIADRNLDRNKDGHVAYETMDAHITTGWDRAMGWVNLGAAALGAAAGMVLAVGSGGTLTPLVAVAWGGMITSMGYGIGTSAYELHNMADHGRSVNPFSSQEAMSQWLNVAGSVAGMGGMGLTRFATMAARGGARLAASGNTAAGELMMQQAARAGMTSKVMNGVGFGIGGYQSGQQAVAFARYGKDMSTSEIVQNAASLLMGATQMMPMAIQKRIGESVRDTYQRTRGPGADPLAQAANRAGEGPDAARTMAAGADAAAPGLSRQRVDGPERAIRPGDAAPTGRRAGAHDGNGQAGTARSRAGGEPDGAAQPRTPATAAGRRAGDTPPAAPRATTRTPSTVRDGADASASRPSAVKLSTFFSMRVRGAMVENRVIANMMDRALARAQERFLAGAAESRRSSRQSADDRAESAAAHRRRIHAAPVHARRGRVDAEGTPLQRRTIGHDAPVKQAEGAEAAGARPLALRQNALSPIDQVLWIPGSMEVIGTPYGAEMAAHALADRDTVMIVTGALTDHGGAETNGIVGAATLGAYLASLGKEVVYVTDPAHARVLRRMLRQDLQQENFRVETFGARHAGDAARRSAQLLGQHQPDAVISIEVGGRNVHGEYHLQNGQRVRNNVRLDQLLVDANHRDGVLTVAVGDHGNEAGMRAIRDRVTPQMPEREAMFEMWSDVGADRVVTGMNSNLAAQAIGFALQRYMRGAGHMPEAAKVGDMLETLAHAGARDGVTHEIGANTVHGMSKTAQKGAYELLAAAAEQLPEGLELSALFEGIQRRNLPEGVRVGDVGIQVADDVIVVTAFDSSNGGLLAAQNIARHIHAMTGRAVQVIAFTDHAAGTYGNRSRPDLIAKVHDGMVAVQKADGTVDLIACNTACTAFPEALDGTVDAARVVDLIQQTAPWILSEGGAHPVIVATPRTVELQAYAKAVSALSGGSRTVGEIAAPNWARGVNELRHLAEGEPLAELKRWIANDLTAESIPPETTSLWFCCTHYPALADLVQARLVEIGRPNVKLVDPMQYQARKGVEVLVEKGLLRPEDVLADPADISQVPDSQTLPTMVFTSGRPGRVSPLAHAMGNRTDIRVFHTPFGDAADVSPAMALLHGGRYLSAVDRVSFNYIGRGLRDFYMPGGAGRAANVLESGKNVMLLTGFSVAPGKPETDGPPGTAELGRALRLRGKQVTYVVDSANKPILEAVLREMGEPVDNIEVFDAPMGEATDAANALLDRVRPDRVMAIELPSRAQDGSKNNMRGIEIDGFNPAIDEILLQANGRDGMLTLGIGDGGNEAGMGGLRGLIPKGKGEADGTGRGKDIAAVVTADHVVTASVSNWGAYGISALLLRHAGMIDRFQTPAELRRVLKAAAEAGAVDGVSREYQPTVDGMSTDVHAAVLEFYRYAAMGEGPSGPGAAPKSWPTGPDSARSLIGAAAQAVVHGDAMPQARTRRGAAGVARAHTPAVRDGSWSLLEATRHPAAVAATIDAVHASGGRLDGVRYVVTHGGDDTPVTSHDTLAQAMASADAAVHGGQDVTVQVLTQGYRGRIDDGNRVGHVPLTLHGRRVTAAPFVLNRAYGGDIRVALPEGFRPGVALTRRENGRRIDHLDHLAQFPRGPAHLDLAQEGGQLTFDGEAVGVTVPRVPGYFTVRATGVADGIVMHGVKHDAAALIARIQAHPDYVEGMPVLLYDCFGQDGVVSLAQQVADGLNAAVYGGDGRLEIDAMLPDGADIAHGAGLRVNSDADAMARSGADIHVTNGGRFFGSLPGLPLVGVTHGGRPAGGHAVPAARTSATPRRADLTLGDRPHSVNAPRDQTVVVASVHPDGGLRGQDGAPVTAHELALALADFWEPGQPVVLALDGAQSPQGRAAAQRVADVMQTEVVVPEFPLQRGTLPDGRTPAVDLAQPGNWRRLQPARDPYASARFDIEADGGVYLRLPNGAREKVELADYLGPRMGSGGAKTVFALGADKAIGIANDAEISGIMVRSEREALDAATEGGVPTIRTFGPADMSLWGIPAIGYERYAVSSKDLFGAHARADDPRLVLLNGRSVRDLDALQAVLRDTGAYLGDGEFAVFADGSVKVADLTHVEWHSTEYQGEAFAHTLQRMREIAARNAGAAPDAGMQRRTIAHDAPAAPTPAGSNGPRPWKMATTMTVAAASSAAMAGATYAVTSGTGVNPVLTGAACFIYRGSVAAARTMHTVRLQARLKDPSPADVAWLTTRLSGRRADAWGIRAEDQQNARDALAKLDHHLHGEGRDAPDAGQQVADATQVLKGVIGAILHPDTVPGRINDALQIGTLAVNNGNSVLWFAHNGLAFGDPLLYSTLAFAAANPVLSTFNVANRLGHHVGGKPSAVVGAQMRKFVMNSYALGSVPLALGDVMHQGGVVGAFEAASLLVFGAGAHLNSRNDKNALRLARNEAPVDYAGADSKWKFYGKAMPYGLVLLGGGVIANFVTKIVMELTKDEKDGTGRPTPTSTPDPTSGPTPAPSPSPTTAPGSPSATQPPETGPRPTGPGHPPTSRPKPRPRDETVTVKPYSAATVNDATLWGIARTHLETLLSDEQKHAADAVPMTPDEQVGNFALRELVNLNPQYRLSEDPDHLEPGWVLDVTR